MSHVCSKCECYECKRTDALGVVLWLCIWIALGTLWAFASGCSGQVTSEPSCTLEGNYTVTVEGCGSRSTQVQSQAWTAPCRDGDQCEPGQPSAFCAFVSEQACGDVWTTFERVEAVAAGEATHCCELRTDGFLVNHFCQTTPVSEAYLEANPGYRCREVP